MSPRPLGDFTRKPTIRGTLVVLRPLRGEDAAALAEILSDPEVRRLTGSVGSTLEAEQPQPPDDRLLSWYATRGDQPDRLDLAIEDRTTGRVVGEVVLNELDRSARSCNLRLLLGPRGRDRGLGTETVRLVTAYGLESLGLERITLEVFEFNPRARRVYEKVGYVPTRRVAGALVFDGVAVAATEMEITAERWSGRSGARRGQT